MPSLSTAIASLVTDGATSRIDAPVAWAQGRTLYGGMTAALCFEATRRFSPSPAPLRSAQFLFTGPATGALTITATALRSGRSTSIIAADCATEGGLAARASFVFGSARTSRIADLAPPAPEVPAPLDCRRLMARTGGFHDNFEMRLAAGSALISGGDPGFTVWVRFVEDPASDPVTALLALADALPPAAMARFPEPAPISSITWSLDLLGVPTDPAGWHLLRTSAEHSIDGYSTQAMELFDPSGALLAIGRQSVAIFI